MSIVDGFLFFKDWEKSMRALSKKDFFDLFWAMYDYQMYGKSFPEFSGKAQIIQSFVEPQLKRRLQNSSSGTRGVEKKKSRSGGTVGSPSAHDSSGISLEAPLEASLEAALEANSAEKEENKEKDVKSDVEECEIASATGDARAEDGTVYSFGEEGKEGGGEPLPVSDPSVKLVFGKHNNVFMTAADRLLIRATIPDSDDYIDMFSEKMHTKGYTYPDHCEAILRWWEKDRNTYAERHRPIAAAEKEPADPHAKYRDLEEAFEISLLQFE